LLLKSATVENAQYKRCAFIFHDIIGSPASHHRCCARRHRQYPAQ